MKKTMTNLPEIFPSMICKEGDNMYPDYLMHHGVKGMKWGIRKKHYQLEYKKNKRYGKNQRKTDNDLYGDRGVSRINARMNKGQTHKQAERREMARKVLLPTAAVTGALAVYGAVKTGVAQRGVKAVSNILTKAKGIGMDQAGAYYDAGKDIVGKILKR